MLEEFYDDFYKKAELSKAHGELCKIVYGENLCQHGMADMNQIDILIELLKVNNVNSILDLGCGIGYLTEYIFDKTKVKVEGIDISSVAIRRAKERTKNKACKLNFEVGNILNLKTQNYLYDAILLIDTHYFIDDFELLLDNLLKLLNNNGQIYIFSDEGRGTEGLDDSNIEADESLIGNLLIKKGIEYSSLNFTKENRNHWNLKKKVLIDLKSKFLDEDNMFIYNNRMDECICSNRELDCRFLFQIFNKKNL